MIVEKTEKVTIDRVVSRQIICDKCKEPIYSDSFNAFKCTFEYREGYIFPEGGDTESKEVDLCQECGLELLNYLRDNKYRVNNVERDY